MFPEGRASTTDRYVHLDDAMQRDAAERAAGAVKRKLSGADSEGCAKQSRVPAYHDRGSRYRRMFPCSVRGGIVS